MPHTGCPTVAHGPRGTTVLAIVRQFLDAYRAHGHPDFSVLRVMERICACRTAELGGHQLACTACGWSAPVYNSCGDRHCPQCRGLQRKEWLDNRQQQILPVPHFQVVATLPRPLRVLAKANPRLVYGAMFRALADTLQAFASQQLGGTLGIIEVLHTWRHDLLYHPHVHALVTAGALHHDRQSWVPTAHDDFLFPTRQLSPVFRGKVLETLHDAFDEGLLHVPGDPAHAAVDFVARVRASYRHPWHIDIEPPDGRNAITAAMYLARYVQGPPISDARILDVTDTHVTFTSRQGTQTIPGVAFLQRFALHILPKRLCRIRYYGLYAPNQVDTRYVEAFRAIRKPMAEVPLRPRPTRRCPECGGGVVELPLLTTSPARIHRGSVWARGPP